MSVPNSSIIPDFRKNYPMFVAARQNSEEEFFPLNILAGIFCLNSNLRLSG
jgi:hypothetical protein